MNFMFLPFKHKIHIFLPQCNSRASACEAHQRSTMGNKNWKPIKPRKFGNDVSVRPTKRASERTPSVQTLEVEERLLEVSLMGNPRNAIFSRGDLSEKRLICICYVNKRSGR